MSGEGPLGVAVVGAGRISEQYLANMARYPDLDVRFVADLRPELARGQAERHGVPASGTAEQALARDDVELIVNLTVPSAHAEVASAALAAGKHVFNEKPLTPEKASAEALVAQADAAGLRLGCAPDTVLGPGLQTMRRMLEAGRIGEPLTASVVMQYAGPHQWHPNPDFLYQPGAGPLFDMAPYYLTALAQAFGPVARVAARGGHGAPTRVIGTGPRAGEEIAVAVPTYVAALYDFASGGVAQATFSFDSPLRRMGVIEIAGSEATLAGPDPNDFAGEVRINRGGEEWESTPVDAGGCGRGIGVVDMARAIRAGVPHSAGGRLGLHVLDAMLATEASIATAAFVEVTSRFDPVPALPEGWDPADRTL
jgi:predicted dehydrogenase